jgi:hypothetical protein
VNGERNKWPVHGHDAFAGADFKRTVYELSLLQV